MDSIGNSLKVNKTFVFQKEETQQSVIVDYQLDLTQNKVNINQLLSQHCSQTQYQVSIYHPNCNRFVSLKKIGAGNGLIDTSFLNPSFILIRYKGIKIDKQLEGSDSVDSSIEIQNNYPREDRIKQRTILSVIEMVKRWRNLHMQWDKTLNRRLSLQEAAKMVGISKKSLDDYYCQLRLGEFYDFDFANRLNQKMGALRNFVKDYRPEKDQNRKNHKHPKSLTVIQQFDLQTRTFPSLMRIQPTYEKIDIEIEEPFSKLMEERYEEIPINENIPQQLLYLQHEYFKGFPLIVDDSDDPYRSVERDFYKKDFNEQESNSFLYF